MDTHRSLDTDLPTDEAPVSPAAPAARCLIPALRASLDAKLQRLLSRPVVALLNGEATAAPDHSADPDDPDDDFQVLFAASRSEAPRRASTSALPWSEDPRDGTWFVPISLDYLDVWRGAEKELLETVKSTVEEAVTFLTDPQRALLERSPLEFLELQPPPETCELVDLRIERIGGVDRVVALIIAEPPKSTRGLRHVAIVPNLIPLQRQLSALATLEAATDDGPLGPLRALVGLGGAACLSWPARPVSPALGDSARLDPSQSLCVELALSTPHFALIQGPPGSGKTTAIAEIIRRCTAQGERVLVVSPTHTAVDNVVEKLGRAPGQPGPDPIAPRSIPVRYAAKRGKVSPAALAYWVGRRNQQRAATIAMRVEEALKRALPEARALYARVDPKLPSEAPLTAAIAAIEAVICGTPLGVLSHQAVRDASAAAFDLLVVDEVSKMTLPEFLAIAVKAKRWVLVGDPQQLPPYNSCEDNAVALDDLSPPLLELCCSVGALVERTHVGMRHAMRVVVVSSQPDAVAVAITRHLQTVEGRDRPAVGVVPAAPRQGVLVCAPDEIDTALRCLSPSRDRDRGHSAGQEGSVQLLVERGLDIPRPEFASGWRLVEPRQRAQAVVFDKAFDVYHCQPWALRAHQKLRSVAFRNGLEKVLPSQPAMDALGIHWDNGLAGRRADLLSGIAERFAVNVVSVYDWLAGMPTASFDVSPLVELADVSASNGSLRDAVAPYVGTLRRQYRMLPSLSAVPRALFYFGEALEDGDPSAPKDHRVGLVQVNGPEVGGESNLAEADAIVRLIERLPADGDGTVMVITPYRAQERLLRERLERLSGGGRTVEVCTLDRCQGREADTVLISLVRSRATPFMDAPKRWNVALTRARRGLFLVGDINAYLAEAERARQEALRYDRGHSTGPRPQMSLLARVIEAYDRQGHRPAQARS